MTRRRRRFWQAWVVLALCAVTVWWPSVAHAHVGDQSYVYVEMLSDRVDGRVEYLVEDLNRELGLGITDNEAVALKQLEENRAVIETFTKDHFAIDLGPDIPDIEFTEFEYLELTVGSYVVFHYTTGDLGAEPPRTFSVTFDGFLEGKPDGSALLIIGRDWQNGIISNEAEHLRVFDKNNTTFDVALDEGSWVQGMRGTISLGIEHIRTGADHVMFIITLLLPSVLLFRNGWKPAKDFKATLLRILKVASSFTIAHSITLSLAGFGLLNLNSKLVETIIAISIILAALHNLRPVFANREWLLAFGFGLFHGLGFAGLLEELGLAKDQQLWTLLGFNIGVEIGQVAIILLTFPTLFLLRRTRLYPTLLKGGSVLLALVALGWALERVFELRPRVDVLFDPVLYYPRVLVLLLLAAAGAAAFYTAEKRRARLLPVAGE